MNTYTKIVLTVVLQISFNGWVHGDVKLKQYGEVPVADGVFAALQTVCRSDVLIASYASSPFVGVIEGGKFIRKDLENGTQIFGVACNNKGQLVSLVQNPSGLCQFRLYQEPGSPAIAVQSVDASLCSKVSKGIVVDGNHLYLGGENSIRIWATNSNIIDKSSLQTFSVSGSQLKFPGTFAKRGNVLFTATPRPHTGIAMYVDGKLVDNLYLLKAMSGSGVLATNSQFLTFGEKGELFVSFFAFPAYGYQSVIGRVTYTEKGFDKDSARILERTDKGNIWQITYSQGKLAAYQTAYRPRIPVRFIRLFEVIRT